MRRIAVLLFALFALPVLGGCQTPAEIKTLSSQQLLAQVAVRDAVDKSFIAMEQVAGRIVEKMKLDAADLQRQSLLDGMVAAQKDKNLDAKDFTNSTIQTFAQAQALVDQGQGRVNSLKQAHQNIMSSFGALIEAQQALDEYLRLQNTDELIVNRLLNAVGVARGDIEKWTDAGTKAFQALAGAAAAGGGS